MDELMEYVGNLRDCPWSAWKPATLHFCEALQCQWIVAPAETWSNIGYLLVGLFLLFRKPLSRFGVYALIVGVFSTLFHASHTYVFETADLGSMLFLGTEMLVMNLTRMGWFRGGSPVVFGVLVFLGGCGLLLGLQGTERLAVFGIFVGVAAALEGALFARAYRLLDSSRLWDRYRPFAWSLLLFGVAFVAWIADYTRWVCSPDQHFLSGHAVWHLVNSLCFLTLAWFYEGVRSPLAPIRPTR